MYTVNVLAHYISIIYLNKAEIKKKQKVANFLEKHQFPRMNCLIKLQVDKYVDF